MDATIAQAVTATREAIAILDRDEPVIRDLIETRLMNIAGVNRTRLTDANTAGRALTMEIVGIRRKAIAEAFGQFPESLLAKDARAAWVQVVSQLDARAIWSAIGVGISAGEDNTDIAHRVIGSRQMNGVNGTTEMTRQQVLRLGRGLINERKSRMRGSAAE